MQTTTDTDFAAFLWAFHGYICRAYSERENDRRPDRPDYCFHFQMTATQMLESRAEFDGPAYLATSLESATIPGFLRLRKSLIRACEGQPHAPDTVKMFPQLIQMRRVS